MDIIQWAIEHGSDLLGAIGIIASLAFTGIALRRDHKALLVANLIAITAAHRDLWQYYADHPEVHRVLSPNADLDSLPVTDAERVFVTSAFQHLAMVHTAKKYGTFVTEQHIDRDIREFFTLPIPSEVWRQTRKFHSSEFTNYVNVAAALYGTTSSDGAQ
jgi:hypothetical protein